MSIVKAIQNSKEKIEYKIDKDGIVTLYKGKEEIHTGECCESLEEIMNSLGVHKKVE